MTTKRGFGSIRRLPSGKYQARYVGPDMAEHKAPTTFSETTKPGNQYPKGRSAYAEAWLEAERRLIEEDRWTPPAERTAARLAAADEARRNTFALYAAEYLNERDLRSTTVVGYQRLLDTRLLPTFGPMPLASIRLGDIKAWRQKQPKGTPSQNASAYRLLRSILGAAERDELIERSPARIEGASTVKVKRVAVPATIGELQTITQAMPERLRLLIALAGYCGLREGELLELRRKDVDAKAGSIAVARAVAKDANRAAEGACAHCGRVIGPPKTDAGKRTVYVPPPLLPLLRAHLLKHAAKGADGLLFPGERKDHMSARYLLDHYKEARTAAGRPDLALHHLRHTALTLAGQEGATPAELKHRAGHSSYAAMAIYQHSDMERDRLLAERIGQSITAHQTGTQ